MNATTYTVKTTSHTNGQREITTLEFGSEYQARNYCRREIKWESCIRVQCEALEIDDRGDFASYYA